MILSPKNGNWLGNLPENKYMSDAVVLNDKVYVIAGHNGSSTPTKSSPPT